MRKQGGRSRAVMLQESKTWWLRYRGRIQEKMERRRASKASEEDYPIGLRRAVEITGAPLPESVGELVRLKHRGVNHAMAVGTKRTICGLPAMDTLPEGRGRMCVQCRVIEQAVGLNHIRLRLAGGVTP